MKHNADWPRQSGYALIEGILVLLVIGIVGFGGWKIYKNHHKASPTAAVTSPSSHGTSAVAAPLNSGTNNASLQSDLTNIDGSLSQQTNDQNAASNALNDQQHEVAVPTN